jgi:hypothetical protein
MNGNDTFLDVNDAHLRVTSGNVYASAFNLDQIDIVMSSNTASTVNFNNPTKAFNAASNIEVGTANLFVDTTTSNVGIGTDTPLDTLHINGGTRFAGHIIPTTNATFDIGSAENKVRDLYVDTNSIWVGDRAKIAFENGKMKFKRRKLNKVPRMLVTLAISGGRTDETDVETHAIAFAQTKDASISSVSDLKLEHLRDYAKTFDNTKSVSDIFADNEEDYEAITASEAFMEVGSNIFTEHSLSIGKTTDPTSALDVEGDVVIQPESQSVTFADVYNRTYYGFSDSLGFSFSTPSRPYGSAATAIYSKRVKYTSTGGLKVSPPDTGNQVYYNLAASIGYYVNFLIGYKWDAVLGTGSVASPYLSGDVFSSTRFKNYDQEDFTGFAIGQVYTPGNVTSDLYQPVPKLARYHSAHMYFKTASSNGTLTEKMRITNAGNVGIGTTSPTAALDVSGTVKATAFEGDGSALTGITSGQWTESSGDIYRSSGNVGVGTTNPESILHVQHTTTNNAFIKALRHNETSSTKPIFAVSEYQMTGETSPGTIIGNHNRSIHIGPVFEAGNAVGSTDIRGIHIKSTGDVGIGTTSPLRKFHVVSGVGDTSTNWISGAFGGSGDYPRVVLGSLSTTACIGSHNSALNAWADLYLNNPTSPVVVKTTGNVGIGTVDPEEKLHVQGQIRMTSQRAIGGTYNSYLDWPNSGHHIDCYKDGSAHNFHINHYAQQTVYLNRSGYSDRRIKEDVKDIDDVSALDTLRKIKPKTYKYKLQPEKGTVYGFIAQDVREVLPYATNLTTLSAPFDREKFVNATILEDGMVNLDGPCNELEIGKNAYFYYETTTSTRDFEVTEIISPTQFRVRVDDSVNEWIGDTMLVGKEVNDFHGIDKDAIFTVTTAALQEVDRQLQDTKAQLATVLARLDALESA